MTSAVTCIRWARVCAAKYFLAVHVSYKYQVALFAEYANTAQYLPRPRFSNGYNPACVVAGLILVMCIQTRVTELCLKIQPGPNGALDTCVVDKEIERRDGALMLLLLMLLMLMLLLLVLWLVFPKSVLAGF